MTSGIAYLVGAGPGRRDLITVRGLELLHRAEVVIYDRLIPHELLRESENAELIFAGKRRGEHSMTQNEIIRLLVDRVAAGKRVVRLKGGDPMIFAHGGEEALALAEAGLRYEIVPGVSSITAAAAYAGIPLTYRGTAGAFGVISGHAIDPASPAWRQAAQFPVLVVMMAGANAGQVCDTLVTCGRDPKTPIACVSQATTADQFTIVATLETLPEAIEGDKIATPALLIVGETAALHSSLRWFDPDAPDSTENRLE
jgi:uroporphyrin-III C-methyltransferase